MINPAELVAAEPSVGVYTPHEREELEAVINAARLGEHRAPDPDHDQHD
jgi:hypothetical protein